MIPREGVVQTQIVMTVEGTEKAAAQLTGVAKAEESVGAAAKGAGGALNQTDIAFKNAEKSASGASVALQAAGKAFSVMRQAAAILPGIGMSTIILGIGTAVAWLGDKLIDTGKFTRTVTDEFSIQAEAMRGYQAALQGVIDKTNEFARASVNASRGFIAGQLGVDAAGLGGSAAILAAQAGPESGRIKGEREKLDAAAVRLNAEKIAIERDFSRYSKLPEGSRAAIAASAEIEVRLGVLNASAQKLKSEYDSIRDAEVDLRRRLPHGLGAVAAKEKKSNGSAWDPLAPLTDEQQAEANRFIAGNRSGINPDAPPDGGSNIRGPSGIQNGGGWEEHSQTRKIYGKDGKVIGVDREATGAEAKLEPLKSAMKSMADTFDGTFAHMVSGATNAADMMTQAFGTISGAVGEMATNLIVAGDAGGKSALKAAGNALAGISAQAFGYSVLLEAMAIAAALTGPVLGWEAPGLAYAGATMAGAGVALAGTARLLGADKLGKAGKGGGGHGASAGGGSGTPSLMNPYAGSGGGDTHVTVILGTEVVTRGVKTQTRKEERRGGISEGRMARAA